MDGILGPKTTEAMNKFSSTAVSQAQPGSPALTADQVRQLQTQLNATGANLKVDGVLGPLTTAAMNTAIAHQVSQNPALTPLLATNSADSIANAYATGDWSKVNNTTGKPFSDEEQQAALATATSALAPQYQEQAAYDTSKAEAELQGDQAANETFQNTQKGLFETDKTNLDQSAANNGVLFSGSRFQANNNLTKKYETASQQQQDQVGAKIAGTANDFAYKYGTPAASTLSQYYNLGGNRYNANVAKNGAQPGSKISSYFDPSTTNYQGTAVNQNKANAQVRAASLLANKANKIVPLGYKTQF